MTRQDRGIFERNLERNRGERNRGERPRGRAGAVMRRLKERRAEARRASLGLSGDDASRLRTGWGLLVCAVFALAAWGVVSWSREQPLLAVGRVMTETHAARVPVRYEDRAATEERRESARQRVPRVFAPESAALDELGASLSALPRTLAGVSSLEQVSETIRGPFALTEETFQAARGAAGDEASLQLWESRVAELLGALRRRPILDEQTWQRATQEGLSPDVRLALGERASLASKAALTSLGDAPGLERLFAGAAREAGFEGAQAELVVQRLRALNRATFRFDAAATSAAQTRAAQAVPAQVGEVAPGTPIYRRGEVLSTAQAELARAEAEQYAQSERALERWSQRAGVGAVVLGVTAALAGYASVFCPRMRRNPVRMAAMAGFLLLCLGAAAATAATQPAGVLLGVVGSPLLVAVIVVIAYDQRVAVAFGAAQTVLTCLALQQPLGVATAVVLGVGSATWLLREIRDRNALFRMAIVCGVLVGAALIGAGLLEHSLSHAALRQVLTDAALGAASAVVVGGATLFLLPTLERWLDLMTGMTLVELRDPKHPLLRELQQRAPGTYNHALNVAAIAEAAADALGADGLLTYVGALYHDVGKMNKPEYFVENQGGGANKHDRLSPAMSVLVIVGHVKDGLELAREAGIPRPIQHFIESHHGTTLVEFFFHRARQQAAQASARWRSEHPEEPDDTPAPEEFDYRYPGPKPRTREAAIVMIADAAESATRSLNDPAPAKIEALVRAIANKRLLDGQFDDCELTLRDLTIICDSVSRTLTSMHHGRVAYPGPAAPEALAESQTQMQAQSPTQALSASGAERGGDGGANGGGRSAGVSTTAATTAATRAEAAPTRG